MTCREPVFSGSVVSSTHDKPTIFASGSSRASADVA